jgi:ABC-2 type transport system ATP-binding protein
MISKGKIAFDGSFDGLRSIAGNLSRVTVTMGEGAALPAEIGKLLSVERGVFEYEVDLAETPVRSLLMQLSQIEGVEDIQIQKAPIEQVIAELFKAWKKDTVSGG